MLNRSQGLTLSELLLTIALLGVIASFLIPKLFMNTADSKEKSFTQDTFALIGESWIARQNDHTLPPATITGGGTEAERFGDYLFNHLNKALSTVTDPTVVNNYCGGEADYFTLPNGVVIRQICEVMAPNHLEVTVFVPGKTTAKDVKFIEALPENAERYTTKFQITNSSCDCLRLVDKSVNTIDTCPSPSRERNIDESCP